MPLSHNGVNSFYAYNADGQRIKKICSGTIYNYYYSDGALVRQTGGGNTIDFLYDENGSVYSIVYNGTQYYLVKNLQGDVTQIRSVYGTVLVEYVYDAWGNVLDISGTYASTLGQNNPIRYRGYYYDSETSLYYLNSRYYDPANRRFLNADNIGYLGTGSNLTGYNLFVYCGNNPVTGYDPAGTLDWGNLFKGSGWLAVGVTAIVVGVSVLTCGVAVPAIMAVAAVTVAAGAATAVNGVSELGEATTGHNFMRDDVFRGNAKASNTYAHTTAAVAEIGTMVCGGWLKVNAPRIEAYNNVQNYTYADGAAKHVGERSYYDSTLLKKEIIKYGTTGILFDELVHQSRYYLTLPLQFGKLTLDALQIAEAVNDVVASKEQAVTVFCNNTDRLAEEPFYSFLINMRCEAFVFALELAVTLPYHSAVFIGRMPHLGAEKLTAVSAHQLCREWAE